ncbi:MAG TPA: L-threonylcarbamoyladenylate synthase [Gaiellaceae bacterium]|nr:L-threonylcarbamoyladenylate synthase [Gaiellaceae bacterium]
MAAAVDDAIAAIRSGRTVILPTDTVYGLAASPYRSDPVERLYRLKGREPTQPTAIIASDIDMLFECVPELRGRAGTIARALLPGPYTLVLANPARRYRWLTGTRPDTIGVRVPELPDPAARVLAAVGAVVATSANEAGGPDPRSLDDVPEQLRAKCAAVVDAGALPGTPSTVLDFTGPEPQVVREGAAPAAEAIERALLALQRR